MSVNAVATAAFILNSVDVGSEKVFQVFPPGEFRSGDGRPKSVKSWWFGDKLLDYLKNLSNNVVIDYEHQSVNTLENGKEAPAAGWLSEFASNEKGLFGVNAKWTERAQTMLKQDEYRYISPVFTFDLKTGEILKLHSIALTNTPAIDGMQPVALTQFSQEQGIRMNFREILGLPPEATDEEVMAAIKALKKLADKPEDKPEGKPENKPEQLKGLFSLLNLPVNATEADAVTAVTVLKRNLELKSGGNIDPTLYAPVSVLSALQNDYVELRRELASIQQATTAARKEELIAANRDKLINDESVAWARTLPFESLEEYLKHIPSFVALKQSQTKGVQPTGESKLPSELTPEEMAICSQLGIGEDEFAKARGVK